MCACVSFYMLLKINVTFLTSSVSVEYIVVCER